MYLLPGNPFSHEPWRPIYTHRFVQRGHASRATRPFILSPEVTYEATYLVSISEHDGWRACAGAPIIVIIFVEQSLCAVLSVLGSVTRERV